MHIVFFAHPSFLGSQSMPRYANWLAKGMEERGHSVQVWSPRPLFYNIPFPRAFKKWLGYIDQYILFPIRVKQQLKKNSSNTLYVFTDNALGPWVPLVKNRLHVVHCHDFLAQRSALGEIPENPTSWSGKIYQSYIRKGYRNGKNFISISENTQKDLHRLLGFNPKRSLVVYNGLNQNFEAVEDIGNQRAVYSELLGIDLKKGFILHVGGNQWYKNRSGVVAFYNAWRRNASLHLPLILVGEQPNEMLKYLKDTSPYSADIYTLHGVSDEIVRGLYASSTVFVFPSLAEGFGWPIAEAMASGCPVITTNEPPMTEVGGSAAYYVDRMPKDNVGDWASKECDVLEEIVKLSDFERETRVKLGLQNSCRFDSENALNKIEEIYQEIIRSELH